MATIGFNFFFLHAKIVDNPTPPHPKIKTGPLVQSFKVKNIELNPVGKAHPKRTEVFKSSFLDNLKTRFSLTTENSEKVFTGPAFIFFPLIFL